MQTILRLIENRLRVLLECLRVDFLSAMRRQCITSTSGFASFTSSLLIQ